MKIIAINGSPRKGWNTAALLNHALEGAAAYGAETKMLHLYDNIYHGCVSCFACKRKNTETNGLCVIKDDLTPIYKKIAQADALLLGAPIYLGAVNGMMHSFFERLLFPYLSYGAPVAEPKSMKTGFIYTLGATEERMMEVGYNHPSITNQMLLNRVYGPSEYLLVNDTYQFDDYSKYETSGINLEIKTKRREEIFPEDCKKAYDLGVWLTQI